MTEERFNFGSKLRGSKLVKIILGVAIAGVFLFVFLTYLFLSLKINMDFYSNRLGLDWWRVFTMDNAAILWCPIVTIIILAIIVTALNPVTSSTLTLISSGFNKGVYRRPSKVKCLIWNYLVITCIGGLAVGWFIGFATDAGFGIFVAKEAGLPFDFSTFISALGYPLSPGVADMNVVFAFSYVLRPFIILVGIAIIAKLGLDILNSMAFRGGRGASPFKVAGTVALCISIGFFIWWLYLPSMAFDVVDSTAAWGVVLGFFASLGVGIAFYIVGFLDPERYRGRDLYKKIIVLAIIVLFILPIGALIAAAVQGLYREANWNQWVWDTKISTQIDKTREAAGIADFRELTTQDLMNNQSLSGITDSEILPHIRLFDLEASRASMENQIGSVYEKLADSDIIYLNESEYWMAPRTISDAWIEQMDWVNEHIHYTHSRGFIALNPVTGQLIGEASYPTLFGVESDHPIYFGEYPDIGYILLNRSDVIGENENITYQGAPDITLSGFLNWWYLEDWGFKTFESSNYLIKRNIFDRVGGILLPHMIMGDDPYLIFGNNRLYYCVDIILDFPTFSGYIQSDIVRWLGVVLIDTEIGTMNFYSYNRTFNTLPYDFLNIYIEEYPWQPMPNWIIEQLKYPEILNEYQLQIDYKYHVTDATMWRSGKDFFERPAATDLHYIIYNVGDLSGLTYVGASFVEFEAATVGNLVGFYIIENGKNPDNLGDVTFYRNGTAGVTSMIGLTAATSAYQQADAQFLQLLANKRFGNFLIYPLAGSLYYVIPVYETTGQYSQKLKRVALVNVFDPSHIGIGNNMTAAYDALNITTSIPSGVLSLNVLRAPAMSYVNTYGVPTNNLELLINNDYLDQSFDVTLNITTESEYFNVSFATQDLTPSLIGGIYTYHIANFSLLPTQYVGITPQITGRLPAGHPSTTIQYNIELYFSNGTLFDSKTRTIYIYS